MGLVFGKIDVEVPKHVVVKEANGFQIWKYPPCVAARVNAVDINSENPPSGKEFSNQAFRMLARYIGVFNEPENTAAAYAAPDASTAGKVAMTGPTPSPEKVAMTGPVVMSTPASEPVAMTAPVVMSMPTPAAEPIAMTAPVVMAAGIAGSAPVSVPAPSLETMAFLLPSKFTSVEQAPVPTNPTVKLELMPERFEAVYGFTGYFPQDDSKAAQQRGDDLLALMKVEGIEPTGRFFLAGYNPPFTIPWLKRNEVHIPVDGSQFQG